MRRALRRAALPSLLVLLHATSCTLADTESRKENRGPELIWHARIAGDESVESNRADVAFNPASIVKVATSLWALERLGPDHRFETRFGTNGSFDRKTGVLEGDLIVQGAGDPDFHVDNAWLVARAINDLGLREVRGGLGVDDRFWIGWEGGSERRLADADRRALQMARRLRDALDPSRWDAATRRSMTELAARRGFDIGDPPRVAIAGGPARSAAAPAVVLVRHVSNPLVTTLKRFNAFSNNDLERFEVSLGPAGELSAYLVERWDLEPGAVELATLSGLGVNRMTPRLVVRLFDDFARVGERHGLRPEDLLPAIGCDPGTLKHFPRLIEGTAAGGLAAKTGTLATTDGGVAVLAGVAYTAGGPATFCVAAPGAGRELARARGAQETWLLALIARNGGVPARACGAPVRYSDDDVRVLAAR